MGLLLGIDIRSATGAARPGAGVHMVQRLLESGILALPAGDVGSGLELSPPAVLTSAQERWAVDAVVETVAKSMREATAREGV
jgi:acetylornithine/succinyldiaminopimelate/putrescine aminotransferase